MDRLEQIRDYLAASMDGDKPKLGYKARVDAIRAEIKRLETAHGVTILESDPPPAS